MNWGHLCISDVLRVSSFVNLYMKKLSWVEKEEPEEDAEEYWLPPRSCHGVLRTQTHRHKGGCNTWISSSGRRIMLDIQMQRTRSKGIWGTRGIYGRWSWRVSSAPRVFIAGLVGSWQDLEGQRKILKSRGSFVRAEHLTHNTQERPRRSYKHITTFTVERPQGEIWVSQ